MNANKTDFITFFVKNDKRLNDMKTVIVGSTIVKKSDHCKYLGVTIDKHLGFQTQVKKVLKKEYGTICRKAIYRKVTQGQFAE